jgi:hypothetical protein
VTAEELLERGGRAAGVRLEGGEELLAERVVLNTDAAAIALGKLGRLAARRRRADTRWRRSAPRCRR